MKIVKLNNNFKEKKSDWHKLSVLAEGVGVNVKSTKEQKPRRKERRLGGED